MENDSKKYISLTRLSNFLDNLSNKFAALIHKHSVSDLTDYTVDTTLSSTSTNPVQNKILDAEFEAIGDAMGALELAIDDKIPTSRTVNGKALTSDITLSASDVSALPTAGVDLDFSAYTSWADVLNALPVGSATTLRKTKINSILLPSDCPDSDYGNIVIRKVNSVYQNCSATLYVRAQGATHIFEATFSQGTGSVVWMKVADASHTHDDRYYTETEVDNKLASKASVTIREW